MMRAPATPHLGHRTAGGGRFAMVEPPRDLDATGRVLGLLTTVELPFTLSILLRNEGLRHSGRFLGQIRTAGGGDPGNRPLAALATRPPEGRPDALLGVAQGRVDGPATPSRPRCGTCPAAADPRRQRRPRTRRRSIARKLLIAWRAGGQQRAKHLDVVVERTPSPTGWCLPDPRVPLAPRARSSRAAPSCLTCWACISGVHPCRLSRRFGSAPASSSSVITSMRPARVAQISGVQPSAAVSAEVVSSNDLHCDGVALIGRRRQRGRWRGRRMPQAGAPP